MFESERVELERERAGLEQELLEPQIQRDHERLGRISKRRGELDQALGWLTSFQDVEESLPKLEEMLKSETDPDLRQLTEQEIQAVRARRDELKRTLEEALRPLDPNDERPTIIEVRPAAGGDEAALFASELLRMYLRFAERRGWNAEFVSRSETEGGGIREAIVRFGPGSYGVLKFEGGVHRVQRVPATESSGRIHTSTVTVATLHEAEESELEIDPNQLRIDVFRSGGHGGQSVNTTDSAVRITHLPTGLVVTCQDEKSQLKNKNKAMGVLRARLLALEEEKRAQEAGEARRSLIGSGDRSEKIRTYNFPQDRLTDHRIGFTTHGLPRILDGELDELTAALQAAETASESA